MLVISIRTRMKINYKIGEFPLWLSGNKPKSYPWRSGFDPWPCPVVQGSRVAMSCGAGHGSDPTLPGLWRRPGTITPIQSLAWEFPHASPVALKRQKHRIDASLGLCSQKMKPKRRWMPRFYSVGKEWISRTLVHSWSSQPSCERSLILRSKDKGRRSEANDREACPLLCREGSGLSWIWMPPPFYPF